MTGIVWHHLNLMFQNEDSMTGIVWYHLNLMFQKEDSMTGTVWYHLTTRQTAYALPGFEVVQEEIVRRSYALDVTLWRLDDQLHGLDGEPGRRADGDRIERR